MAGKARLIAVIGLVCVTWGGSVTAGGDSAARTRDVRIRPGRELAEPLALRLWPDRPSGRYAVGEPVRLYVEVTRDCQLTVVNIGASGQVTIMFPNRFARDNRVQAGMVYALAAPGSGWRFTLTGPPGQEGVLAICVLGPHRPAVAALTGVPREIEAREPGVPGDRWAIATIALEVMASAP